MVSIESGTYCGCPRHTVVTDEPIFAVLLYERALNESASVDFHAADARFTLEFTVTREDLDAMISAARRAAGGP